MTFKGVYNLRLVSAESVVSAVFSDNTEPDAMFFANPMEVQFYPKPTGNTMLSLTPWMPFGARDEYHQVYMDSVIAMSKCNQEMVDYYNSVVLKYNNGFVEDKPQREEIRERDEIRNMDDLEDSLDIIEAMTQKAKGKLH